MDRHTRQARLVEVGISGQARIASATFAVGADGLAADVAVRYLTGAGAGRLRIRDAALADVAHGIDHRVRVDVDPSISTAAAVALDVRDPVARAFASGALFALRALRGAIQGEESGGVGPGGCS